MTDRPDLSRNMDSKTFRDFYYLKQELEDFCRKNGLPVSGGKIELTDRIAYFLETGGIRAASTVKKKAANVSDIHEGTRIESDFVCTERHRAFFKSQIGKSFSFNVVFQKWLKNNAGRTYKEAVAAYYQILEDKKKRKSKIEKQFEYNTYIRDFFTYNPGKSLEDAIRCWKYKKSLQGHNRYEPSDFIAVMSDSGEKKDCKE